MEYVLQTEIMNLNVIIMKFSHNNDKVNTEKGLSL